MTPILASMRRIKAKDGEYTSRRVLMGKNIVDSGTKVPCMARASLVILMGHYTWVSFKTTLDMARACYTRKIPSKAAVCCKASSVVIIPPSLKCSCRMITSSNVRNSDSPLTTFIKLVRIIDVSS